MWWNMGIKGIFLNKISTPARALGSFSGFLGFERNIQVQSQVPCGIPQNRCVYQLTIFMWLTCVISGVQSLWGLKNNLSIFRNANKHAKYKILVTDDKVYDCHRSCSYLWWR